MLGSRWAGRVLQVEKIAKSLRKEGKALKRILSGVLALLAVAVFVAAGGHAGAAALFDYTPPVGIIPTDVSSANLTTLFSQIMTNGAVLTVLLMSLAGGLFAVVWRAIKRARSA